MVKIYSLFTALLLILMAPSGIMAQDVRQKIPEKTRILFVLDGSGSMNANWGDKSRMDAAKDILTRLIDSLRVNPKLDLALRVYGHRYERQSNNCQDSKLEVPFGKNNHTAIIHRIREIRPKGVTPITYSLEQAATDFPAGPGYRNILILITDGIESCGGDPCSVSLSLQRKGIFLRPFIIGLGVEGGKVLDCMGRFVDAQNSESFNDVLNQSITTTFAKTTVSVELLNGENQPRETNINVTFVNDMTGNPAYEFIHYRDRLGRPDSVQVDPVLSYDIVVNTLPPVTRHKVPIVNGKHNVIEIPVPQGWLVARPEGHGNPFLYIVRVKGQASLLNVQSSNVPFRYLAGQYEVETLTLPRRSFSVSVDPDKTTILTLPSAGMVNINTLVQGYGSIFEILESGETRWVCNLDDTRSKQSFTILPGNYKLTFRSKQSKGSKYTDVKTFEVRSGATVNVSMF